jgi:hypothetical protein
MGRKIPAPVKAAARAAFFMYEPISEIAARHDLSEKAIHKWVYGRKDTPKEQTWLYQRAEKTRELAAEVYDDEAKRHIVKLWRISMPALVKAVKYRAEMSIPLTIDEAEAVTRILMSFDKLRRLDTKEENPGNLPEVPRPYTMQELQDALTRDKFFSVHVHVHKEPQAAPARDVSPAVPGDPFAPKEGA